MTSRQAGNIVFGGRRIAFREGDTIAAALHRADVRVLARSRKFHRPRGLSGAHMAGHLVMAGGIPHVRADRMVAADGLRVVMENVWPGQRLDLMRLARLIPRKQLRAGFEHTNRIKSGTALFEPWERFLRVMAGEATVPPAPGRGIVPGRRIEADVAVVGGGPAGRAAAAEAVARGQRTVLVTRGHVPGAHAAAWGESLADLPPGVEVLAGHEACGLYDTGRHLLCAPFDPAVGATVVAARELVLATGRLSVPPLVPGADLPGVMDAATALSLAWRHGVAPGRQVVVIGTGAEAALGRRLAELGSEIVAVLPAGAVERIVGWSAVSGIEADGHAACDAVVHAGPWRPDGRLAFMAGAAGKLRLLGGPMPEGVRLAGSAAEPPETIVHGSRLDRRALVCPCMDVTVAEILDLVAAGEEHPEVLKRLTGCGMGPCQGVPCWDALAHVVAAATGSSPEEIGHPTYRPPGAGLTLAQAAGLQDLVPLS